MCFFIQQNAPIEKVEKRFNAKVDNPSTFFQSELINGFAHLNTPIIIDNRPEIISTNFSWGLMPSWAKSIEMQNSTLNARIETIDEKPSFKNNTKNRCLIIATAFYEWHWKDPMGKVKEKYQINSQQDEIFALAGLYSNWLNKETGIVMNTFTILTTEANDIMMHVHNSKHRMPVMVKKEDEKAWLDSTNLVKDFAFPYSANLIAIPTNN